MRNHTQQQPLAQQQPRVGISGRACGSHLLFFVVLSISTIALAVRPALAAPAYSRGIQNLAVSFPEAVRRAEQALPAEGYSITYRGGENSDRVIIEQKGVHTALIMCNAAPEGKSWVNIVVASESTTDGGVPGRERQRLQAQMDRPVAGGTTFSGDWQTEDRTTSGATYRYDIHLRQVGSRVTGTYDYGVGGTIEGTVTGNVLTFTWSENNSRRRGAGQFTLAADGKSFTGTYTVTEAAGGSREGGVWKGTRK